MSSTVNASQEDWNCPITHDIMLEPVKASPCEHVFEKNAIEVWRKTSNTCPLDRGTIEELLRSYK